MTTPKLVVYLTCLLLENIARVTTQKFSSYHREARFVSANVGESLTLQCFYKQTDATTFYWYKQSLGQTPKFISSTLYMSNTFNDGAGKNPRFTLEAGNNHLHITDLRISDSATYYCAIRVSLVIEFTEGIVVSVKGSGLNSQTLIEQSTSEIIQPGGSETLSCTVHTGTCDGEHRVYWFKTEEKSHLGLIYTHGRRNDQCERKPNQQRQTCVYNLPMKSLNLTDAGTYYCALASCGRFLFGNGTKLDIDDGRKSLVLVYFLSGALTFTVALVVLLAFLLFKMSKRNSFKSESQARFSAPPTEGNQDADNLHYAALSIRPPSRSQRQRNTKNECVYSTVKQ